MSCEECNYALRDRHVFWEHFIVRHTGVNVESLCDECSQVFSRVRGLRRHVNEAHLQSMRVDAPQCDDCGFRVRTLFGHYLRHHTVRRTALICCDDCGSEFRAAKSLKQHIQRRHLKTAAVKKRRFTCDVCQKACGYANDLYTHCLKKHVIG